MEENSLEKILNEAEKIDVLPKKIEGSHLIVGHNKILSFYESEGVVFDIRELRDGVKASIIIKKKTVLKKPILLCFTSLFEEGFQEVIIPKIVVEEGAQANLVSICMFPNANNFAHRMSTKIEVKKSGKLIYNIYHYHGDNSGAKVYSKTEATLDDNAFFNTEFVLDKGTIGSLNLITNVDLGKNSSAKLFSRVIGRKQKDRAKIKESIKLLDKNAKGILETKGVAFGGSRITFEGFLGAGRRAEGARGHMDCEEIVIGNSFAKSVPAIEVLNQEARITHEASVGKINQKELETLLVRGLSEEEAINFIIYGKLPDGTLKNKKEG